MNVISLNKGLFTYGCVMIFFMLIGCVRQYEAPSSVQEFAVADSQDSGQPKNVKGVSFKIIEGKVTRILDGDTFAMIFENGFEVKIRLNGIDAPERSQAFSKKSKSVLSEFIFAKTVQVKYNDQDRYGRILGDVFVEDVHINQEMVRAGMAWHFKKYSDDKTLSALEVEAREARVGLWSEPNPTPPWEYRKR